LRGEIKMKRYLLVILVMVLLVLSFGNAFAGGPPPSFGITTEGIKLGDLKCDTWRNGMHGLIVDGPNVYAARTGGLFSENEVVMDKSNDGGITWLNSTGIARGSEIEACGGGIAINPVTKALHYVWAYGYPTYDGIYYGNGSITTRVNGLVTNYESNEISIAVDGNGVIHIVFFAGGGAYQSNLYYTSSFDNGLTFSDPTAIASSSNGNDLGDYSFAADSAGNLYLVYLEHDSYYNYYFMKKPTGSSWSSSPVACPGCEGHPRSMAIYDSNRIYFAMKNKIAATSNGGQTWTLYTAPGNNPGDNCSLAISSDGILNYAWYSEDSNVYFARTKKSHDPSSWGQTVVALTGADLPNVAVDSAGKAYIMATRSNGNVAIFTKEK